MSVLVICEVSDMDREMNKSNNDISLMNICSRDSDEWDRSRMPRMNNFVC